MARNRNKTRNNTIKILSETPAKRCEICHKSDKYDSDLNTCNRCDRVSVSSLIDDDWTGLNHHQATTLPELLDSLAQEAVSSQNTNDTASIPLASNRNNHNPNRINISRSNTLLANRPNPSNPFDQLNQIDSSNHFNNFNQSNFSQPNEVNEVSQIIDEVQDLDEIKAFDESSSLNQANKVDDGRDEFEEMDKPYPSYESTKVGQITEVNEVDKLYDSTNNKPFNELLSQLKYRSNFINHRLIIVGLMVIGFIICIFFISSSQNSKSPSLYDLTVKNGKIIKDEVLTINTEVSNTDNVESENVDSSTEVEEIPYQLDLSLSNPQDNPYITLAVDGVTVVECDEPIIKVINGSESLAIEPTTFPTKKLYLIGKDTLDSGNLILITKTSVFSLYYEIRTDATAGNFNVLVKIKKQSNNNK